MDAPLPNKISTGCKPIDALLGGGITKGSILLVFGERGSGKTTLAFQTMLSAAASGQGSTFVYSEGRTPLDRLIGMAGGRWLQSSERMWILDVKSFEEQENIVEKLDDQLPNGTGILIIDSITARYREALGTGKENIPLNKALNREMALIKDHCIRKGLTVLLTSEVSSQLFGKGVKPVAASILTYWSDAILRLEKLPEEARRAVLDKPSPPAETIVWVSAKGLGARSGGHDGP
jgi:DNA repair protein RadB